MGGTGDTRVFGSGMAALVFTGSLALRRALALALTQLSELAMGRALWFDASGRVEAWA